jgi:sugar/nucleoside kinase (ribokinase family)
MPDGARIFHTLVAVSTTIMYDLCCIGHITSDKIVTPGAVSYMPGGTAFYFSCAISRIDLSYLLVTAVAESEMGFVKMLQEKDCEVLCLPSAATVCFENIYSANQDHRVQKVTQKADAFHPEQLKNIQAKIFHLGPLLADDIPLDLLIGLSARARVSLDIQGYLRSLEDTAVVPVDWPEKIQALKHIHFLKANETEAEMLTGTSDIYASAELMAGWGVAEVIITLGSKGSLVLHEGNFYRIPAYPPEEVVDATGCGDTYMAGYLYQRLKGSNCEDAARFAAAMATIKIQKAGPFNDEEQAVNHIIRQASFK